MPKKGKRKSDAKRVGELLVLIGGIVSLLFGILFLLNFGGAVSFLPTLDLTSFLGGLTSVVLGVVLIIISLATLATSGVINLPALKFKNNWIVLLIFGILMYIFGGTLGGILVILGAILMLF
ncbi:MAG: hypothetical protein ACXADL_00175 [Candidatus Thorarchaeota archaeon]